VGEPGQRKLGMGRGKKNRLTICTWVGSVDPEFFRFPTKERVFKTWGGGEKAADSGAGGEIVSAKAVAGSEAGREGCSRRGGKDC